MSNPFNCAPPSRGTEGAALDALRDQDMRERIASGNRDAIRELLVLLQPLLPERDKPNILALMDAAMKHPDREIGALQSFLESLVEVPALKRASDFAEDNEPDPVLWRDSDSGRFADAVLSVGEVALLSGAGGLGKSFVALALARAAAASKNPRDSRTSFGAACGLRIRPGATVLLSYEDSPVRIAARLKRMHECSIETLPVYVIQDPHPLWQADPEERGESKAGRYWHQMWDDIRSLQPSLVIVDPASAALEGVSTSDPGPVRAFLRALTAEAGKGGFGCLVVAHDTKAARNEARGGGDPGSGSVAGSSAWWDAARGVLYFRPSKSGPKRILQCVKSNYGSTGWGAELRPSINADGRFQGYRLDQLTSQPILTEGFSTVSETGEDAQDTDNSSGDTTGLHNDEQYV